MGSDMGAGFPLTTDASRLAAARAELIEVERERDEARQEVAALREAQQRHREAQQRHLELIRKMTHETPYPAELDECRSARSALIAEVGTLRARVEELEGELSELHELAAERSR